MTDTLGTARGATDKAKDQATGNPITDVVKSEAADRLKEEVQDYLSAQAQRMLTGLGHKLGETTGKLNDIAEGNSPGFAKLALDGGKKLAEGKGPLRSALELGASRAKDNVVGAFKKLGGGKGKKRGSGQKPTVIIEFIDVGVPLRTAYDQWTQYQDFSTFAKGVKSASRADDTHSDCCLLYTSRQRISWSSEGAKGTTKGVVSFHQLAENLTRVLLVIEYYPTGFFEKTGNIWRAQGRRARLDLKHFARFITLKGEVDEGWRGEIRDGELVKSHDDAVAEEEEQEQEESAEDGEAEGAAEDEEADEDEEEGPYAEDETEAEDEEEPEADEEQEGEYDEEEPEEDEEPAAEDEVEEEDEYEDADGGSRR
ncbi:SRPBCC family protein [Streptomyces resistomycificus]|uniref:SRPBCC family protein n=1 Tax=Streptomyces resistomycificus TaxID=67356 RepID=UPI0004AB3685|nr:SRPBCC family protein [Streptomyces resistomycificus]